MVALQCEKIILLQVRYSLLEIYRLRNILFILFIKKYIMTYYQYNRYRLECIARVKYYTELCCLVLHGL